MSKLPVGDGDALVGVFRTASGRELHPRKVQAGRIVRSLYARRLATVGEIAERTGSTVGQVEAWLSGRSWPVNPKRYLLIEQMGREHGMPIQEW